MLRRVGFFDAPGLDGERFPVLVGALQEALPVPDEGRSLLVLPELFNLKEPYYPNGNVRTTTPASLALDDSLSRARRASQAPG